MIFFFIFLKKMILGVFPPSSGKLVDPLIVQNRLKINNYNIISFSHDKNYICQEKKEVLARKYINKFFLSNDDGVQGSYTGEWFDTYPMRAWLLENCKLNVWQSNRLFTNVMNALQQDQIEFDSSSAADLYCGLFK